MVMSTVTEAADLASDADVQAALDRILASEGFRTSPQLGAFLRYVVEAALGGRAASLKGYTIGVEALGRDASFDPQADPIVRVEATRLRRALERYYASSGSTDPLVIDLPRGSYVPVFIRRSAPGLSPWMPPADSVKIGIYGRALAAILLIVTLAGLAVLLLPWPSGEDAGTPTAAIPTSTAKSGAPTSGLPPGNGMPVIAIEALRVAGTARPGQLAAGSLGEKIRDAFARFDTINVAYGGAENGQPSNGGGGAVQPRLDYRLTGSLEYGETATTLRFQLVDAAENTIAFTRDFVYPAAAPDQGAAEDEVVVALTNSLLQSYGVIRARDHARHLASPAGDPRYRCVLDAAESLRSLDPAAHDRARSCLEYLTTADPSFAIGFEFLAIIYYREDAMGYRARPGDPPALDRALRAARRAVELAPASARAYQNLFVVHYARHEVGAAFAAGERAISLNPYDMLTLAEYGGRLVMTGDVERGLQLLRRAGGNGIVLPNWHHYYRFLGNYLAGNLKEAAFQAEQITAEDYPLGLVARAIAANRTGNADQARRALDRLIEVQPAWRTDARRLLEKSIYDPASVDQLMRDLAGAGLAGAS
jgi:tetratricopeptide (TPR) repeat protein